MKQDNLRPQSDIQESYGYLERLKFPGLLIVIFTFLLTILFYFLNINASYDPAYLVFILNFVFVGISGFIIAVIALRGFLRTGIWAILWLGISTLTFGLAAVFGSLLIDFTNVNVAITFHNIVSFFAASLFFLGGFFILNKIPPKESSGRFSTTLQVYIGVLIFVTFIAIICIQEFLPPFFVEGVGGTMQRQIIVGLAALLFLLSGIMIFRQYRRSNSLLLYWFSLGLFLMSLGMGGILLQTATGTPLNWMGRGAQLLGGVYLLMAALVALNVARKKDLSAGEALASFFQERKQNLNLLFESITEAIIISDLNNVITGWNKGAEEIYGWKAEEAIGNTYEFLMTTNPGYSPEDIKKQIIENDKWSGEIEQTTKDDRTISVWASASIIKDESGKTIGIMSVNNDFTDRKKAEEALKEAHDNLEEQVKERTKELSLERQRLFDVLETVPIMVCLLTPDYHVAFANRAFREVFGESEGRHCYDYCFGNKEPCEFCESFKPLETGEPHYYEVTGPEGRIIDVYDFPFTDIDGSPLVLEMDVDVTEQKLAEEQLKQLIDELELSNKELQSFAYITSHDLQEPLRTIASFTQLLERRYKGQLDDDADEFMDYIVSAAVRMKAMIQDLLDYSRVDTQSEPFKEFNSEEAVNQALNHLHSSIEECNAKITFDNLPSIIGDEHQITRVFQNLIGNALKFRKEGVKPEIHISSQKNNGEFIFSVADNGIGMEEEYSERIFEPFRRLHTIDVYEGTGIGLAVVKRIIEHHGGRIWFESELGIGSTFYFTIPRDPVETGGRHSLKSGKIS